MCKVKELKNSKKRVTIITGDGKKIEGDWFVDATQRVENRVNMTEREAEAIREAAGLAGVGEGDVKSWYVSRMREDGEAVYITDHAMQRMKERCGWSRKAAKRMVAKVIDNGRPAEEEKGFIRKWVKQRMEKQEGSGYRNIIYGDHLFMFNWESLITVIKVPSRACLSARR